MDGFYYQQNMLRQFLKSVAAVSPGKLIPKNLKIDENELHVCDKMYDISDKNIYVIGFGKAVLGMANECEKILQSRLKFGVICAPHNIQHTLRNHPEFILKKESVIKVMEGAENNLPDENAVKGTSEIISLVKSLDGRKDHLIVLISGGGSALFTKPKPGISWEEKREAIKLIMESGADINELNTIRKKISLVKGGGLASLSHPVPTTCLIISDVVNDTLGIIASGPTVPCSDSPSAAFDILNKYNLMEKVPKNILQALSNDFQRTDIPAMTNKFPHVDNFLIGNNTIALNTCKKYAEEEGFNAIILSNKVKGNIERVSDFYTDIIYQVLNVLDKSKKLTKNDFFKNCDFHINSSIVDEINDIIKEPRNFRNICLISGGETTVKVDGDGKGGRNQELALITSIKVYNLKQENPKLFAEYEVCYLFAGTDGQDGPTDAAGAMGDSNTIERAMKCNLSASDYLLRNDSYNFFNKINDGSLIRTGYTGTNVMDVHIFNIYKKI